MSSIKAAASLAAQRLRAVGFRGAFQEEMCGRDFKEENNQTWEMTDRTLHLAVSSGFTQQVEGLFLLIQHKSDPPRAGHKMKAPNKPPIRVNGRTAKVWELRLEVTWLQPVQWDTEEVFSEMGVSFNPV